MEWKFKVFLDKKEVGVHDFLVEKEADVTRLETVARFDVKILFFNAFRYRHRNIELWNQESMTSIDAYTDSNGKESTVRGEQENGRWIVNNGKTDTELPERVLSFAYFKKTKPGFVLDRFGQTTRRTATPYSYTH